MSGPRTVRSCVAGRGHRRRGWRGSERHKKVFVCIDVAAVVLLATFPMTLPKPLVLDILGFQVVQEPLTACGRYQTRKLRRRR